MTEVWGVGVVGSSRMSCAQRRSYDTVMFQHVLCATHFSFLLHYANCCCLSPIFSYLLHRAYFWYVTFFCFCCTLPMKSTHCSFVLHGAHFCSMSSIFIVSPHLPVSHFCCIVCMFVALCVFVFCVTHFSYLDSFRRADPKKQIDDGCSAPPLCCL